MQSLSDTPDSRSEGRRGVRSGRLVWLEAPLWRRAVKSTDTIATVFVVDPIIRFVLPLVLASRLSPNALTMIGFGVSIAAAWAFLAGHLVIAGLLVVGWYTVDCIDGKVARLNRATSKFGHWLDLLTDRVGMALVFFALAGNLLADGDSETALLVFGMLAIWLIGNSNQDTLIRLASEFSAKPVLVHADPPSADAAAPLLDSLVVAASRRLQRFRLSAFCISDVEWMLVALTLGPIIGAVYQCLVIGAVGMLAQKTIQTTVFWWRRRDEIRTAR